MIKRDIEKVILKRWDSGKAIILLGTRQTGKTTLLKKITSEKGSYLFLDCDEMLVPFISVELRGAQGTLWLPYSL